MKPVIACIVSLFLICLAIYIPPSIALEVTSSVWSVIMAISLLIGMVSSIILYNILPILIGKLINWIKE